MKHDLLFEGDEDAWRKVNVFSSLTGYRVFLRSNSEEWKSHETLAEAKVTTHTIRGLKCGTKYQVYMLAFNEVGNSDPSESLAFSTEGGGKCWSLPTLSKCLHPIPFFMLLFANTYQSSLYLIRNLSVGFARVNIHESIFGIEMKILHWQTKMWTCKYEHLNVCSSCCTR